VREKLDDESVGIHVSKAKATAVSASP